MTAEDAKKQVGPGWAKLIDHCFLMAAYLWEAGDPIVVTVTNRIGMLSIRATSDHATVQDILNRLSWTLERDSAKVCEQCGAKGYRRKVLPGSPNRCRECYIALVNQPS